MFSIGIKNNLYGSKNLEKNYIDRRIKWLKGDRGSILKIYVLTMPNCVVVALILKPFLSFNLELLIWSRIPREDAKIQNEYIFLGPIFLLTGDMATIWIQNLYFSIKSRNSKLFSDMTIVNKPEHGSSLEPLINKNRSKGKTSHGDLETTRKLKGVRKLHDRKWKVT